MMSKSTSLTEKLTKYGLMSTALLGGAELSGQIVYTDVSPDVTLTGGAIHNIDFNNDAITDIALSQDFESSSFSGYSYIYNRAFVKMYNANSFRGVANGTGNYHYPFDLDTGAPIGASQTDFFTDTVGTLNWSSCNFTNSQWCGGTVDKYLGIKFNIGTNTHYGWVRLDVSADATTIVVKDFAYNSVAGAPINAGQQVLSTNENVLSSDFTYYLDNDKNLNFRSKKNIQNVQVYSAVGQLIVDEKKKSIESISLASAKKGVYVVKLNMEGETKSFKILIR